MIPTDIGEHEVWAGNPCTIDLKVETDDGDAVDMSGDWVGVFLSGEDEVEFDVEGGADGSLVGTISPAVTSAMRSDGLLGLKRAGVLEFTGSTSLRSLK